MSSAESAFGRSNGGRESGPNEWANAGWRGACGVGRWSAFEVIAMVLGFAVFWPIGLAILGYKFWQRKFGGDDLQTFASARWDQARAAMSSMQAGRPPSPRPWSSGSWGRSGHVPSTGNRAFDDWKSTELSRLEEERRKLEEAHLEFAEFVENIRKAKDREEFERFMSERRSRPAS